MANLQFITIFKNQLSISIILGMMMLIPINSIGSNNLQPSEASMTIQQTHKLLSFSIPGGADFDTLKNNLLMDTHYPGGIAAWNLFFKNNFKYSDREIKYGINAMVNVLFTISKDGQITNPKIKSSYGNANKQEVLRVVKMMPGWIPVRINDQPADVPFEFVILLHQDSPEDIATAKLYNNEEILTKTIDQSPQFPGGYEAMLRFLKEKINYPNYAQETGTQGTVNVGFVVRSTGKITNVVILKGIGNGCDEEAVRIVKLMPDWIPGMDKGKAVSIYHMLPVKFGLQIN